MVDHWVGGKGRLTEAPGKVPGVDGQIWPERVWLTVEG